MVAETAQDAIGALAQKVSPPPAKQPHRKWPWVLLALVVLGALAAWWMKRSAEFDVDESSDYGAAPDVFGEAVTEERAALDNGRTKVATPGA
jgi:hypothetical protein